MAVIILQKHKHSSSRAAKGIHFIVEPLGPTDTEPYVRKLPTFNSPKTLRIIVEAPRTARPEDMPRLKMYSQIHEGTWYQVALLFDGVQAIDGLADVPGVEGPHSKLYMNAVDMTDETMLFGADYFIQAQYHLGELLEISTEPVHVYIEAS